MRPRLLLGSLILAYLWEAAGVLFFGWDAFLLLAVYWAENVVIGLFTLPRLALSRATAGAASSRPARFFEKALVLPFFVVHYGGFTLGHGLAIAGIGQAIRATSGRSKYIWTWFYEGTRSELLPLWIALGLLVWTHASALISDVLRGRTKEPDIQEAMFRPYPRILVLHLSFFAGALLLIATGAPRAFALGLLLIKIVADLWMYRKERAATA